MSLKKRLALPLTLYAMLTPFASALAWDLPPPGSVSLSAILQKISPSMGQVTDASYDDDGYWELKVCQPASCQKIYVEPNGNERFRRYAPPEYDMPPPNAMTAATIVRNLEAREGGRVIDIEFERGRWEVEMLKATAGIKLYLDINGQVVFRR